MFFGDIREKMLNWGLFYYWRPHYYSAYFSEVINKYKIPLIENFIAKSCFFDDLRLLKIQTELFKKIIAITNYAVFWKKRLLAVKFKIDFSNFPNEIQKMPVLTKNDIRDRDLRNFFPSYLNKNWVWIISTSGTTGEKTNFLQDKFGSAITEAFFRRALKWASLENSDRILIFNFLKSWSKNLGIHISIDKRSVSDIYLILCHYEPEGVFTSADILVLISQELRRQNKFFKLKAVLYNGRALSENEKDLIEKTLGCESFSVYGASECSIIASECSAHEGLHINSERLYLEIVDNNGKNLPVGETGKILLTIFDNEVMPLIRYEVGDLGKIYKEPCNCGIKLPRLYLQGRHLDSIDIDKIKNQSLSFDPTKKHVY